MSQVSPVRPVWAAELLLRAVWVAADESPEWIAARTDALLNRLGSAFDVASWQTPKSVRWQGSSEALADIVRGCVVRDKPTVENPSGEPFPAGGYKLMLYGATAQVGIEVRIVAGSITPGRRIPGHTVTIDVRELVPGSVTSDVADLLCASVVDTFDPAMVKLSDSPVNRLARRGGWKIGVGYRLWLHADVGAITELADGLTSTPLATGTLISAPDDWSAEQVVAAITQTLTANDLDEVPR